MAKKIARYESFWHPKTNKGVIEFEFEDGGESKLFFTAANAVEMTTILQILQDPNPSFVTEGGWVATRSTEPKT